jgi:hypothetical protein
MVDSPEEIPEDLGPWIMPVYIEPKQAAIWPIIPSRFSGIQQIKLVGGVVEVICLVTMDMFF